MDSPTFEAIKRIMELIEPRSGAPAELREDWHRVASWMQEAARDIDDLETRDERMLVPGTCFSIEPGIYLAGQMAVRSEIDVFITPAGRVEVFGAVQRELLQIG